MSIPRRQTLDFLIYTFIKFACLTDIWFHNTWTLVMQNIFMLGRIIIQMINEPLYGLAASIQMNVILVSEIRKVSKVSFVDGLCIRIDISSKSQLVWVCHTDSIYCNFSLHIIFSVVQFIILKHMCWNHYTTKRQERVLVMLWHSLSLN